MRIGHLEKAILTVLLKHGAKTSYELIRQIEGGEGRLNWTRQKAFLRTIKQLRKKNLVIAKPYFKYSASMYGYMENKFWANGCFWRHFNGSGFFMEKTRQHSYGFYHIFGLTHQGKNRAHMSPQKSVSTSNFDGI